MERLTYWCDNGHGGGKWFVAIDAEGREDYGPHYGGSRMADILTIIAAVEWMALGLLVLWKLKGWNRKMEELYEDMKKQWEAEE